MGQSLTDHQWDGAKKQYPLDRVDILVEIHDAFPNEIEADHGCHPGAHQATEHALERPGGM